MESKVCKRCQIEKLVEEFYLTTTANDSTCKVCRNTLKRQYWAKTYVSNPRAWIAPNELTCSVCRVTKPASSEFFPRRRGTGADKDRLRGTCHECYRAQAVLRDKRHNAKEGRRTKQADNRKKWRKVNRERWHFLARQSTAAHRALKKGLRVEHVRYDRILDRDGMSCYLCQALIVSMDDLEMDHVYPLAKGGEHSERNIKPTHGTCNAQKSDTILEGQGFRHPEADRVLAVIKELLV